MGADHGRITLHSIAPLRPPVLLSAVFWPVSHGPRCRHSSSLQGGAETHGISLRAGVASAQYHVLRHSLGQVVRHIVAIPIIHFSLVALINLAPMAVGLDLPICEPSHAFLCQLVHRRPEVRVGGC